MKLILVAIVVGMVALGVPDVATAMYERSGPAPVVTVPQIDAYNETAVRPTADGSSDRFLGEGAYVLIGYVSGLLVAAASYYAYRAWERRHHGAHLA